jgi:prepilin-type N-terminal cleavage/methylation domain-containing protein
MRPNIRSFTSRRGAFTLVEVLIATTLSGILLAAIFASFMFLTRSGANLAHYSMMESEAQRGLELFGRDVREASDITWTSATDVELSFNAGPSVRYSLGGPGGTHFVREQSGTSTSLVTSVYGLAFVGYNIAGGKLNPADLAVCNLETKQLQLRLVSRRKTLTVAAATNRVLSARFILRNKRVSS